MTWAQAYRFSEPFRDLRGLDAEAEQLRLELMRELSPGHSLHGLDPQVIATAIPQDDVVVETATGEVALVHLTWTGKAERSPWPDTEFLGSPEHLDRAIETRY
jgi:hypothetical protein